MILLPQKSPIIANESTDVIKSRIEFSLTSTCLFRVISNWKACSPALACLCANFKVHAVLHQSWTICIQFAFIGQMLNRLLSDTLSSTILEASYNYCHRCHFLVPTIMYMCMCLFLQWNYHLMKPAKIHLYFLLTFSSSKCPTLLHVKYKLGISHTLKSQILLMVSYFYYWSGFFSFLIFCKYAHII